MRVRLMIAALAATTVLNAANLVYNNNFEQDISGALIGGYSQTRNFKAARCGIVVYDILRWYAESGIAMMLTNCPDWKLWEAEISAPPRKQSGMYSFSIFAVGAPGDLWLSGLFRESVSLKAIVESRSLRDSASNRIAPVSYLLSKVPCGDVELSFYHALSLHNGNGVEDTARALLSGSPVGQQQLLNFVSIKPYFEEQ